MERNWKSWQAAACAGLVLSSIAAIAAGAHASGARDPSVVQAALAKRLPKTEVTAIDCNRIAGVCEVQAGQNLFYIDHGARYLIVGRVYDMETKQDLTAARLLEMNPDMLLGGGGGGRGEAPKADAGGSRNGTLSQVGARIDPAKLAALPTNGSIVMGRGGRTITVFSDFRCGYCKRLHDALETLDVQVVERPISVLGTRSISEAVICAADRRAAALQAYEGAALPSAGPCDTTGLDANEAFARQHGFTGTPVIVRDDGAVLHGLRPREFLQSWIEGKAS